MAQAFDSTSSSGYGSSQTSTPTTSLNPHYLCYWLDSCNGQHELIHCEKWREELRGKLGIYYSPTGAYKLFTEDRIRRVDLTYNNTGCTLVHLLVYNYEKKEILFGLKWCKESKNSRQNRFLLLAFPSAKPCRRNERILRVPTRAFQWLTMDTDFANQCLKQGLKNRFLFQNANVIYPVHLTDQQASKLTREFRPNEEFQSLHWYPLAQVLSQLPPWPNYLTSEETTHELAQTSRFKSIRIQVGEHELWYVVTTSLMCIREHVPEGFVRFLKD